MKCLTTISLGVFAAASFYLACGPSTSTDALPSRADCAELRAHVAELNVSRATDRRDPVEIDDARAAMLATLGDSFVDSCARDTSPAYVQCALESTSRGELTRCP